VLLTEARKMQLLLLLLLLRASDGGAENAAPLIGFIGCE